MTFFCPNIGEGWVEIPNSSFFNWIFAWEYFYWIIWFILFQVLDSKNGY